jgi:hypothetical protein
MASASMVAMMSRRIKSPHLRNGCYACELISCGGARAGPTSVPGSSRKARGCRAAVVGPEGQDRHRKRGHQHKPIRRMITTPRVSAAGRLPVNSSRSGPRSHAPCREETMLVVLIPASPARPGLG